MLLHLLRDTYSLKGAPSPTPVKREATLTEGLHALSAVPPQSSASSFRDPLVSSDAAPPASGASSPPPAAATGT